MNIDYSTARSLNYVLDCSSQRMKWYMETGDKKYIEESKIYLDVANIYMKEIKNAQTCENTYGTYCS